MTPPRRVLVSVSGGCVEVDALPEGVEVLVTDYDERPAKGTLWERGHDGKCYAIEQLPDRPDEDDREPGE